MRDLDLSATDAMRERLLTELAERRKPERPPPDIEARKAAIRKAAARLFAERGLAGASVADAAASLGMPATTCFSHYRTRNELIYAILHEHATALHDALDAAYPLPGIGEPDAQLALPPMARLDALSIALLDALAAAEPAQRVLLAALHTLPEMGEGTVRDLLRGVAWRVERVLLLAIPRLRRRRALVFPLAASFLAMAAHYVLWFRDDGRLGRADYARLIARMAVAGGKAAYREHVGKMWGTGGRKLPEGALLGAGDGKRARRGPAAG